MLPDGYTDRARKVFHLAADEAHRFVHEHVGTEHILLGLRKEGNGVATNVLQNFGIDLQKIRLEVQKLKLNGPEADDQLGMRKLPLSNRGKKVIEYSMEEARDLNHLYIGTEHILLALTRIPDCTAVTIMANLGLTSDTVREEVLTLLGFGEEVRLVSDSISGLSSAEALISLLAGAGKTSAYLPELIDLLTRDCPVKRQVECVLRGHYQMESFRAKDVTSK